MSRETAERLRAARDAVDGGEWITEARNEDSVERVRRTDEANPKHSTRGVGRHRQHRADDGKSTCGRHEIQQIYVLTGKHATSEDAMQVPCGSLLASICTRA